MITVTNPKRLVTVAALDTLLDAAVVVTAGLLLGWKTALAAAVVLAAVELIGGYAIYKAYKN